MEIAYGAFNTVLLGCAPSLRQPPARCYEHNARSGGGRDLRRSSKGRSGRRLVVPGVVMVRFVVWSRMSCRTLSENDRTILTPAYGREITRS